MRKKADERIMRVHDDIVISIVNGNARFAIEYKTLRFQTKKDGKKYVHSCVYAIDAEHENVLFIDRAAPCESAKEAAAFLRCPENILNDLHHSTDGQ